MFEAESGEARGVKIRTLEVGDDISLLQEEVPTKPRGVAGTVLLYKILGAASVSGKNLDELCELGERVLSNMQTLGTTLDRGSLPG